MPPKPRDLSTSSSAHHPWLLLIAIHFQDPCCSHRLWSAFPNPPFGSLALSPVDLQTTPRSLALCPVAWGPRLDFPDRRASELFFRGRWSPTEAPETGVCSRHSPGLG